MSSSSPQPGTLVKKVPPPITINKKKRRRGASGVGAASGPGSTCSRHAEENQRQLHSRSHAVKADSVVSLNFVLFIPTTLSPDLIRKHPLVRAICETIEDSVFMILDRRAFPVVMNQYGFRLLGLRPTLHYSASKRSQTSTSTQHPTSQQRFLENLDNLTHIHTPGGPRLSNDLPTSPESTCTVQAIPLTEDNVYSSNWLDTFVVEGQIEECHDLWALTVAGEVPSVMPDLTNEHERKGTTLVRVYSGEGSVLDYNWTGIRLVDQTGNFIASLHMGSPRREVDNRVTGIAQELTDVLTLS
ncbi:hypothetical protein Pelo_1124 [Pelomyxa schiedti]|nr:hypothetical protein Pelo_1124 [Pelomyxa schiedti]